MTPTSPIPPGSPARPRILIVDDDPASRRLLARNIERDYQVIECPSGSEAIQLLTGAGPALVLLDYQMPDLNGAQVCELIRTSSDPEIAQCPIIMLTAHSNVDHEIECLKAGADEFVTKPVNLPVLRARIDTHLRLHSLRKQLLEQNLELEKWRRHHEEDLQAARLTQQAILPARPPSLAGWSFAATFQPLMQIGGDIYDWFKTPAGSLLVWMSDATGHGASAALLTTLSKLLFRHAVAESHHPAAIMDCVQREFQAVFKGHSFMTAACLSLSPDQPRITFCGAGHPPLLIARQSGKTDSLRSASPPLGLNNAALSIQEHRDLGHRDALLLHTDGLYEIRNPAARPLGADSLAALLPSPAADTAAEWLARILAAATTHAAGTPFPDDIAAFAAVRE